MMLCFHSQPTAIMMVLQPDFWILFSVSDYTCYIFHYLSMPT
uniref:Uncharacterized protein n=1 Tax=Rhizophora mucronata TaxID=61149 RepID=A0A2P2P7B7_RHIMU